MEKARSQPGSTTRTGGQEPVVVKKLVYTIPEVAGLLGISPAFAYQLERQGKIPGAIRLGKRILIGRKPFEKALGVEGLKEELLKSNAKPTTTDPETVLSVRLPRETAARFLALATEMDVDADTLARVWLVERLGQQAKTQT